MIAELFPEAGLILIEVDYISSKKAVIEDQKYSPSEIGLGKLVHLQKDNFIGKKALEEEQRHGVRRQLVGLEVDWNHVERLHDRLGLVPQTPSTVSRVPVPVYAAKRQVGKATSTTWSPVLKKMLALASVETEHSQPGTRLDMEFTVEAVRHTVPVTVSKLPFFNPARKTATPPL